MTFFSILLLPALYILNIYIFLKTQNSTLRKTPKCAVLCRTVQRNTLIETKYNKWEQKSAIQKNNFILFSTENG